MRHEFEGEARLFAKATRRQVVRVSPGGLAHFDQLILDATPEISVGKPKGDAELRGKPSPGLLTAPPDIFQQPEDTRICATSLAFASALVS
jgi:hypothetical protein